jgi:hypothetical protein
MKNLNDRKYGKISMTGNMEKISMTGNMEKSQ